MSPAASRSSSESGIAPSPGAPLNACSTLNVWARAGGAATVDASNNVTRIAKAIFAAQYSFLDCILSPHFKRWAGEEGKALQATSCGQNYIMHGLWARLQQMKSFHLGGCDTGVAFSPSCPYIPSLR